MSICVYLDEGVSSPSFRQIVKSLKGEFSYPILSVDHTYFLQTGWEESTRLVVFPGGRDIPYHKHLRGLANRNLKAYVHNGGSYLGICAGAYYGSASVEFEKGGDLEVLDSRELCFFEGKAIGPVYGNNLFRYDSHAGARASHIQWKQDPFHAYYNGGCLFEGAEDSPNLEILARYHDLPENPPAVICCKVGRGIALLSGIHPEYPAGSLDLRDPHLSQIETFLRETEEQRQQFWRFLLLKSLIFN